MGDPVKQAGAGARIEGFFNKVIGIKARYFKTLRVLLFQPSTFINGVIAERTSDFSRPAVFLVVSWAAYACVATAWAEKSDFLFVAPDSLDPLTLFTKGISVSDVITCSIPLMICVSFGSWCLAAFFGVPSAERAIVRRVACYVLPLPLLYLAIMNLVLMLRDACFGGDDFEPLLSVLVCFTTIGVFIYAPWLIYVAASRLRKLHGDKKRFRLLKPILALSCFVFVICAILGSQAVTIWRQFEIARIFSLVEPVLVSDQKGDVFEPERWRFDLTAENKSKDTLTLTKSSCTLPDSMFAFKDLRMTDWSAGSNPVLILKPGETGWIRFELTAIIGGLSKEGMDISLDCTVGEKKVWQALKVKQFKTEHFDIQP